MHWQPASLRVIEALQKHPEGLSSRKLAHIIQGRQETISTILSKLLSYGAPIEKLNAEFGPRVIWRWKQKPQLKVAAENKVKPTETEDAGPQPTPVAARVRR